MNSVRASSMAQDLVHDIHLGTVAWFVVECRVLSVFERHLARKLLVISVAIIIFLSHLSCLWCIGYLIYRRPFIHTMLT